ncbi:MAG: c-type cytochrome [Candidatus Xenobia bacterium]
MNASSLWQRAGIAIAGLALIATAAIPVIGAPAAKIDDAKLTAPPGKVVPGKWVIPKDAASIAAGKKLYKQKCASCHGLKGQGDGPAAATLDPKPRNYTKDKLKFGMDDAHLFTTVWMGARHWPGASKTSKMAPWGPQPGGKPPLLTHEQVLQILAYVKSEFLSKNPTFHGSK